MSSDIQLDPNERYVFEGIEVQLTGRTAVKRRSRDPNKIASRLYEIKPVNLEQGSQKQWVSPDKLYEIQEDQIDKE